MEKKKENEVPMISSLDNFYAQRAVDYTYTNSYDLQISPTSAITDTKINFTIPQMAAPSVFFLSDVLLRLKVRIEDKDKKIPEEGRMVAPINMFPSAMFRQCRIFLNEIEIR